MSDKPIHTIRIGSVKATIWENTSQGGKKFFSTGLVHTFKDENDNWKESSNYLPDDLPKLELAARKAFEFIHTQQSERQNPGNFTEKVAGERSGKKAPGK
jgi:hypothetical protein